MILINDTKYSCVECIRGHRSSLCRHHMRPLLQVRSKGRPNLLFPEGNKDYRIAVFAQEVEDEGKKAKCKDTPVIILKTSGKHVINLSNGHIVGPYVAESEISMQKAVGPDDFVNTTTCCPSGSSRTNKGCECNQSRVLKKKILRSFFDKRVAAKKTGKSRAAEKFENVFNQQMAAETFNRAAVGTSLVHENGHNQKAKGGCCGSKDSEQFPTPTPFDLGRNFPPFLDPALEIPTLNCGILKQEPDLEENSADPAEQEFHAIAVPSCSIPGTCSCLSNCSCPSCVVHLAKKENTYSLELLNNDAQYGSNLILTLGSRQTKASEWEKGFSSNGIDWESKDLDSYTSYLTRIIGCNVNETPGETDHTDTSELTVQSLKCSCADNSCFCSNCETHSIINGYRLDDIFGSHGPMT